MTKKKNKQNYIPTSDEKCGAPSQFLYEFNMFKLAVKAHINLASRYPAIQEILKNVTLESLLVHARNLIDFFFGPPIEKDDIRAFHFIKGDRLWHPSKSEYLKNIRLDIHKNLSHLTYSRVSKKPIWDWGKIEAEIDEAYKEFLEALPDAAVAEWKA